MAKHRYTARVDISGGVEETQFSPEGDAPRVPSRYEHDSKKFGRFKHGKVYKLDPEKAVEEAEEEIAEQQIEQAKEEAAAMNEATPKRARKGAKADAG